VQALRRACRLDLEGATGRAPGPATIIDLSGLTFADVAGCRALAAGTEELRRAGGTVCLVGVSGHLRKVLSLLGTDQLPGFDVL
jgi:anti-anti-sigma factor